MRQFMRQFKEHLGENGVLVSVVDSGGSTPRGPGAHMLVTAQGRAAGTVGGGMVERRSERLAQEMLGSGQVRRERFSLGPGGELGMVCGGQMEVVFRPLTAGDPALLALVQRAEELLDRGERSWLMTETAEPWALAVYGVQSGLVGDAPQSLLERLPVHAKRLEAEGRTFCCQPLVRPGRVYIFGGGHVAQKLAPALAAVEFRCVVLEDRAEFCLPERFPEAEEVRLIDYARALEAVELTGDDYVVIMTRGHKDDLLIQAQVMKTPVRYIGVIGSRRKTQALTAKLQEMGFTDFQRVHAPIGLEIRSETPAEIAVSITAQLILERAGGANGSSLNKV